MLINTAQNKNSGRGGSSGSLEHLPLSTKNSKQAERKEGGGQRRVPEIKTEPIKSFELYP